MALTLAATPLGNPLDASPRLKMAIESAEIIAAEDSRRFHRLASDIGASFSARILSFFEGNERDRTVELLALLREGRSVLVLTDAGMPTISDPGFRLLRDAVAANIEVHVIPGPSAPTMAIALSGLPTDRFTFEGFAPRTSGARIAFYESLQDALSILGSDRPGAICREMTKTYEETIRGTLAELIEWAQGHEILGEITLVFAGVEVGTETATNSQMVSQVREYESAGMDRKDAIATVARELDIPKKLVYAAVVEAQRKN